jgi:hypothetical protein
VKQNVMQPLHMAIVPPICNAILWSKNLCVSLLSLKLCILLLSMAIVPLFCCFNGNCASYVIQFVKHEIE